MYSTHANFLRCQAKTGPVAIQKSVRPRFGIFCAMFTMDLTATDAAQLCALSVRSVNTVYQRIRVRLAQQCAAQSPFSGELEADESYFGPRRIRGKRGRGAGGKTIVFGLLKRGDCVYTEIVADSSKATLQASIRGKVDPNSIIHTDGWRGYDGLVDWGLDKHFRVNHGNQSKSKAAGTSTASSLSGVMPNIGWCSFMVCDVTSSSCISRRPSFASTTAILISTRHCLNCSEMPPCEAFAS